MKIFRIPYLKNQVLLIAAVSFLNMNFFVAEVKILAAGKDNTFMERLCKLATCGDFEEEREAGEESTETSNSVKEKEIDYLLNYSLAHSLANEIAAKNKNHALHNISLHGGHLETFSPPPES